MHSESKLSLYKCIFSQTVQLCQSNVKLKYSISGKMKKETSARLCLAIVIIHPKVWMGKISRYHLALDGMGLHVLDRKSNTTCKRFLFSSRQRGKFTDTSAKEKFLNTIHRWRLEWFLFLQSLQRLKTPFVTGLSVRTIQYSISFWQNLEVFRKENTWWTSTFLDVY